MLICGLYWTDISLVEMSDDRFFNAIKNFIFQFYMYTLHGAEKFLFRTDNSTEIRMILTGPNLLLYIKFEFLSDRHR